tara:strand:+ start:21 stop:284 length:264 start_codon:yes stop_codon:yes gene_type:complete
MKFKPNGSWVVLPDPSKIKTDSGIILDKKTAREKSTNILKVLAIGPDCKFIQIGDLVMVDPRTEAIMSKIDKQDYLLVGEHQILGKW